MNRKRGRGRGGQVPYNPHHPTIMLVIRSAQKKPQTVHQLMTTTGLSYAQTYVAAEWALNNGLLLIKDWVRKTGAPLKVYAARPPYRPAMNAPRPRPFSNKERNRRKYYGLAEKRT